MQISLTENALRKLSALASVDIEGEFTCAIAEPSDTPFLGVKRLRIEVNGGGCSGYQYKYSVDEKLNEDDIVFEHKGVGIVVDQISVKFIQNATVDYIVELGGEFFQIKNPNVQNQCGCGNSFSF
jgi:iron-sulfur cluster insertion protein